MGRQNSDGADELRHVDLLCHGVVKILDEYLAGDSYVLQAAVEVFEKAYVGGLT